MNKPLNPSDTPLFQAGLHHHGEEPARAGYTVAELLTLARSSHPRQVVTFSKKNHFSVTLALMSFSQVVLGLEVLTQLLGKIGRGELDGCFHQNLVCK